MFCVKSENYLCGTKHNEEEKKRRKEPEFTYLLQKPRHREFMYPSTQLGHCGYAIFHRVLRSELKRLNLHRACVGFFPVSHDNECGVIFESK